jgi:hypothetical protein
LHGTLAVASRWFGTRGQLLLLVVGPLFQGRVIAMATSMLISILITFLVIILVLYLVNMLPIDGRAKQIVRVIVIIIGVISMLKYLAVF